LIAHVVEVSNDDRAKATGIGRVAKGIFSSLKVGDCLLKQRLSSTIN
jgi:hypothetical protein